MLLSHKIVSILLVHNNAATAAMQLDAYSHPVKLCEVKYYLTFQAVHIF
mgnify:CR=1 FL=1